MKQFPHETLYGTIFKTIEIGPTANQTISTFAMKMKNNWATIETRITRVKQKVKKRLNAKKNFVTIKPKDKAFLSTIFFTNNRLNTAYIGAFKIINVKNTTVELFLPDTKIFLKFHASLIKKTPPDTPLTTTWNYSTKEKYEMEKILQKKKGEQGTESLIKWKNYDISEATWEFKTYLTNAQTVFRQFRKKI